MNESLPYSQPQEKKHEGHALKWLAIGTALAAGAVIVSPYVLPLIGVGEAEDVLKIMRPLHGNEGSLGEGLAGFINKGIDAVPLIGHTIATNGFAAATASGLLGIGGMLLNHYSRKSDDGKRHISWGKVIGTAAMMTSALIALPAVLTGLTAGISFIASSLGDTHLANQALGLLKDTLGFSNSDNLTTAASTAAFAVPHLLTCGAGMIPAAFSFCMPSGKDKHAQHHAAGKNPVASAAGQAMHGHGPDEQHVVGKVLLEKPTTAGEMVNGRLVLTNAQTGELVTADQLKVVNEAKIHFFINNSSLTDYHHIHPTPSDKPGEYDFSFKANTSQPYKGWGTITTLPDNKHTVVQVTMPPAVNRHVPPNVRMNSQTDVGGLTFDWKMDGPMQKGKPSHVEVTIKDANGKSVTDLQPVYGEWSHLEGFHTDLNTMVHTHPTGREPQGPDDRMSSPLHFTITPEKDGPVQFYVQVKRNGEDIYAPIGQMVKGPEKAVERVAPRSGGAVQVMTGGYGIA